METILIVIHLMIVVALVVVVLLQRSEGGALGIGGGGGGLMSARGAANALTKTTGILAAGFFVTSLSLGILARYGAAPTDILDQLPSGQNQPSDGGSLLDQLGGLPSEEGAGAEGTGVEGVATPENAAPATGAATDEPSQSLIPDMSGDAPAADAPAARPDPDTGSSLDRNPAPAADDAPASADTPNAPAVEPVPANPGETAPNAADPAFIPPVEAPSAVEQAPDASEIGDEEPESTPGANGTNQ